MMIEPPGDLRRGGVLEVHDRILLAIEQMLVEECARAVDQPGKNESGGGLYLLAVKARKQRGRSGAVETAVVEKYPDPHRSRFPFPRRAFARPQMKST